MLVAYKAYLFIAHGCATWEPTIPRRAILEMYLYIYIYIRIYIYTYICIYPYIYTCIYPCIYYSETCDLGEPPVRLTVSAEIVTPLISTNTLVWFKCVSFDKFLSLIWVSCAFFECLFERVEKTYQIRHPFLQKSRSSNSSVQIQVEMKVQSELVPGDTEECEFLHFVDLGSIFSENCRADL